MANNYKNVKRFAVMGGAYGNIPALKASIEDAISEGCEILVFLGDAIGFCGHSDEILKLIRDRFDIFISGNHEQQAALGLSDCGCGYESKEDEEIGCAAFEAALSSLNQNNKKWLSILKDKEIIETSIGKILLCHGSPERTNEFLYGSQVYDEKLQYYLEKYDLSGFVCTHTGIPWLRYLSDNKFAANCGVAGKSDNDGDPAVHYLILSLENSFKLEIRRVAYDYKKWADKLKEIGINYIFINEILTGCWTCGIKSLPQDEKTNFQCI
ncbi:MAG: metallophosphoesterase family protein [Thermodesulfobacteriota bacterium]